MIKIFAMRYATIVLLILIACLPADVQAQYNIAENSIWAMGRSTGMDFNTYPPAALSTSMVAPEGGASVSGGEYGLRFYTNGKTVWNGLGNIMPNGDDILGPGHSTESTTQAAVIVPAPGSSRYYYVFSLTDNTNILSCNRVDMTLDGNRGDIDTGFPLWHVVLEDSLSEKMAAVPGCNNNVWLLVCKHNGTILAYEITAAGVNLTPVISTFNVPVFFSTGMIKVSPKADRIAACNTQFQFGNIGYTTLFHFDYTSGVVTLDRIVDSFDNYSCTFSPDGTKLYTFTPPGTVRKIKQLDLNIPYPGTTGVELGEAVPADLKLAIDGKIYFISSNFSAGFGHFLGRIENPDAPGLAAGYHDTAVNLSPGWMVAGFPNEVVLAGNIPPGGINRVVKDTSICDMPAAGVTLKAAPAAGGYTWDNNSTGNTRTVTQAGIYFVRYPTACGTRVDTFKVIDRSINATLQFTKPLLRTESGYTQYRWYKGDTLLTGETGDVLSIRSNSWYSVVVENQWGCRDSVSIQVTGYTAINQVAELSRLISVYPNPASGHLYIKAPIRVSYRLCGVDGRTYLEGKENRVYIAKLAPGLYFLKVCDRSGNSIKIEKVLKL
ncbi:T9SS type A sorting domain-containing protein [Taibaiella koreensis]|uniref:T9SS type A sorting domain-containing protein n=1 Tax=Taibaiella koreensis TaxID=1268548 RepID=UPI0013C2B236|nr:T9SS type A sorting domain-containing protein [Taibaiella koreensis]